MVRFQRTYCIIKPEGMTDYVRAVITRRFEAAGLRIVRRKIAVLHPDLIARLYLDLYEAKNELWDLTLHELGTAPCEAMIVEGDDAIAKVLDIIGHKTDPAACAPGSIRHLFGSRVPIRAGKFVYWRNVAHRSKNDEEAENDEFVVNVVMITNPDPP